jgi:hypothetical protein
VISRYPISQHTTTVGTDLDEYFPSGTSSGVAIDTRGATSVTLITHRESETGTCTLQAFVEFYAEVAGTTGGLWYPLLDLSNATQVQGVVYADAAVDTTTPFHRFLTIRDHNRLTTAADNVVAVNTVHKYYNMWLPEYIRFRFRSGGTTVSNTFSGIVLVHRQG